MTLTPPPSTFDPWLSIFTKPRTTVKQMMQQPGTGGLQLALLAAGGIIGTLSKALGNEKYADQIHNPVFIVASILIGALSGIIGSYISSWLVSYTGRKILKGTAPAKDIRGAYAWTGMIAAWLLPFLLIALFIQPDLSGNASTQDIPILLLYIAVCLLIFVGSIWWSIAIVYGVSAVTGFGFWKALWNIILAILVLVIPIIVVVTIIAALSTGFVKPSP